MKRLKVSRSLKDSIKCFHTPVTQLQYFSDDGRSVWVVFPRSPVVSTILHLQYALPGDNRCVSLISVSLVIHKNQSAKGDYVFYSLILYTVCSKSRDGNTPILLGWTIWNYNCFKSNMVEYHQFYVVQPYQNNFGNFKKNSQDATTNSNFSKVGL